TVSGKQHIVVPLVDESGNVVAEVRLKGKAANSFAFIAEKLSEIFNLKNRMVGGLAYKWNTAVYRDPKTGLFNRKSYYEALADLHSSGQKYTLVRADLNYYGSWNVFNNDFSTLGTELGDAIFRDFAEKVRLFFKQKGMDVKLARLGGDELGLIFTGENLDPKDIASDLQELGQEMRAAELNRPIKMEGLSEKAQECLKKYIKKHGIKPNPNGSYTVDLYKLYRWAEKYGKFVKGMGISFGIHRLVDPTTMDIDYKKVDKDADGIANRAKNGGKNGNFKIAIDGRTEGGKFMRRVYDELDVLISGAKQASAELEAQISEGAIDSARAEFLGKVKAFVQQKTGIELKGANTKAEIEWILKNSAEAVAEKYGIDVGKAESLRATVGVATHDLIIEGGEVTINPKTGEITIKTGEAEQVFTSETEAKEHLMQQIKEGKIKARIIKFLDAKPGSTKGVVLNIGGMGAMGAVAEGLVALIFETAGAIGGKEFDAANVGAATLHGGKSWAIMGAKMELARALGIGTFGTLSFAVLLPMLQEANSPFATVDQKFVTGIAAGAGLSGFVLGEKVFNRLLVGKGIQATWPKRAGGAFAGALVASLTTMGTGYLLGTEWAQQNISFETRKFIVDNILGNINKSINSYVVGEITGALANLGTKALLGLETGGVGYVFMATGVVFDGITNLVMGDNEYEKLGAKMVQQFINDHNNNSTWYNWLYQKAVRDTTQAFYGQNLMSVIDTYGGGFSDGCKIDGSNQTCLDYVTKREGLKYWTAIIDYYGALFLKHSKVVVKGGKVEVEFDTKAINAAVNGNGKVRWALGFLKHFWRASFDSVQPQANGTFILTPKSAKRFFKALLKANPGTPQYVAFQVQQADGSFKKVSLADIVAEQKASAEQKLAQQKPLIAQAQKYIELQGEISRGDYSLGGWQHEMDMQAGLVDENGNLVAPSREVAEMVEKINVEASLKYAEMMLYNLDGAPASVEVAGQTVPNVGDFYSGLHVISQLISQGKLDGKKWLGTLPKGLRKKVKACLKHAKNVSSLRTKLGKIRANIGKLEPVVVGELQGGITASENQVKYMKLLAKTVKALAKLEEYYKAAGYSQEAIDSIASFRQEIQDMLSA
ncbi:MAG: GGDEF domain-containing protein, partial [Candidatus Margulisbacteria bacterium]|nr:GGDEF domain-containing protein [Candidatus Margulisiibacteriota bacterium]